MQDRELYRQILGIDTPWFVKAVELKLEEGEVHVHLERQELECWPCPECGADCRLYDHQPERRWRHLDTCQYQTILHAKPPRIECGGGKTRPCGRRGMTGWRVPGTIGSAIRRRWTRRTGGNSRLCATAT